MSETAINQTDRLRQIIETRNRAKQELSDSKNQLLDLFQKNRGEILPLKSGRVLYKSVEKNGIWQREYCGYPVIADEYVVGSTHFVGGSLWTLEVAQPRTQAYEWFVIDVDDIHFASPEEVAETRSKQEQLLEYAKSLGGISVEAESHTIPSSTAF